MATRSNILLITHDNKVHQFYHHWDGYLSGVGEELRKYLVYSAGLKSLVLGDLSLYDILVETISNDESYQSEEVYDLTDKNDLHADIEFLYVIDDASIHYICECETYKKFSTYKEVIDHVLVYGDKISLAKHYTSEDDK